jgi:hypothetical protein
MDAYIFILPVVLFPTHLYLLIILHKPTHGIVITKHPVAKDLSALDESGLTSSSKHN